MADVKLMPLAGMDNAGEDAALQVGGDEARVYVRDAVNVDITPARKLQMRSGVRRVSTTPLANLWHSPLHADTFATLGADWVRVNPVDWSHEVLAEIGEGDVSHLVLNSRVLIAGPAGIFVFDGTGAQLLAIPTPPRPLVAESPGGSLVPGRYGAALSWLRGPAESALSEMAHTQAAGSLSLTFPAVLDPSITGVRLYLTRPDGGELLRAGDFPAAQLGVELPALPDLGAAAQFRYLAPMPTGRFLSYWRGRLLTAKGNVIRFSEALAYHLHDERHGFVQMPQRVTFLAPVDGGVFVGQVDHVAFLRGAELASLEMVRLAARAPVPGSAVYLGADEAGQYDQGGAATVLWLADNGYVAGTSAGTIVENTAGRLRGISAPYGVTAAIGDRVLTILK